MSNSCYEIAPPLGEAGAGGLQRLGFQEVHRKGSHIKMEHADGRRIVFPYHRELDRFTLRGALHDAGVPLEEFIRDVK